jgi:SAC3 family protein LENG8/THP3
MKPKLVQQEAPQDDTNEMDLNERAKHLTIKGTCTVVEKHYFRLTQAPDPAKVRPEPVLKQALKLLKAKWDQKTADYIYIDDQFRSLRQDLTVQRIQNDFCVKVYETHARIALEQADLD